MIDDKYQLIIFDCDGTLVDTEYPNNLALCQILEEASIEGYDIEYAYRHWVGRTLTNIFIELREKTGLEFPDALIRLTIERTKQLYDTECKAIDGVLGAVTRIAARYPSCVASNGERSSVFKSLRIAGYMVPKQGEGADQAGLFEDQTVFTRIQVPNGKPAPDLFLFAAENMGFSPDRCLVIEDSPTGVLAGVAAGMQVWGFTGASQDPEKQEKLLLDAGATQVFSSFIHIAERLGL